MLKTNNNRKPDTLTVYKTMHLLGYMKRLVLVQQGMVLLVKVLVLVHYMTEVLYKHLQLMYFLVHRLHIHYLNL
jgi:hypothetical protein